MVEVSYICYNDNDYNDNDDSENQGTRKKGEKGKLCLHACFESQYL